MKRKKEGEPDSICDPAAVALSSAECSVGERGVTWM